jgi:hypothetical protein
MGSSFPVPRPLIHKRGKRGNIMCITDTSTPLLYLKTAFDQLESKGFSLKEPKSVDDGYPSTVINIDQSVRQAVYAGNGGYGVWVDNETMERLNPILFRDNDLTKTYKRKRGML